MSNEIDKKLLIVTPHLAPENHAAVFRMHKLIKYLPEKGWKIYVVAPDTNYEFKENKNLLREIPESVEIHRTSYIEPSLRGLRKFFGFNKRINTVIQSRPGVKESKPKKPSPLRQFYAYLLNNVLYQPDRYWLWQRTALKKASQLIKKHDIPYVLTTSMPFSTIEIGRELKEKFDIRWICDHRDPLTYSKKNFTENSDIYLQQKEIEFASLKEADAITTLTSSHKLIFADLYGDEFLDKVHFISTGLDQAYLPSEPPKKENRIVYVGEFLPQYGSEFLRILERVSTTDVWNNGEYKFEVIGNVEINKQHMLPIIERYGLKQHVVFTDQLSQKELYVKLLASKAAVLSVSREYPWWCCFAKLVDYIALGLPVLAVVPDPSESRKWLQKSGLGVFLDDDIDDSIQKFIDHLSHGNVVANKRYQVIFTANYQVESFEGIILG